MGAREITGLVLTTVLLLTPGCKQEKRQVVQDERPGLAGSDVYLENFRRRAYKKGKIQWELRSREAYVFSEMVPSGKKAKAKYVAEIRKAEKKLQADPDLQRNLIRNFVEKGERPFELAGKTIVIEFEVDHYQNGKFQTNIKGEYGYIVNEIKNLHIEGNVVAESVDNRRLESPYLNYNAQTEKLHTLAEVHIEAEEGIMDGVGMFANADLSWIQVLNPTGIAQPAN